MVKILGCSANGRTREPRRLPEEVNDAGMFCLKKNGQKPKANKVALHAHIENHLIFCLGCSLVKWMPGLQNKRKGPQRGHSKYLVPGFSHTAVPIKILLNQLLIIFKWLISSTHDLGPLPISNLVFKT